MVKNGVRFKGEYEEYMRIGEDLYEFILHVKRKNDTYDKIKCQMQCDDKLIEFFKCMRIQVTGQICSKNKFVNSKSRLEIFILVDQIKLCGGKKFYINNNLVSIKGYICKEIILRKTRRGAIIADIMVALNNIEGTKYYIPCIAWEEIAKDIFQHFQKYSHISIQGRLQSREYPKKYDDGAVEIRTVNEVSIVEIK